ncbi:MAG TPA: prephenate dehydratase [Candidatus Baltobacteraceae bacterium]|jgi:prephenate dehydratase
MTSIRTVGFQGEPGAFSEEAANNLVPDAQPRGYRTFAMLIAAVDGGEMDAALLPIENSISGQISANYDLLWAHQQLTIVDETVHRVVQSLLGIKGATIERIREVRSHPVALEQCGRLFAAHPDWTRTVVDDTAGAVREIVAQNDPSVAAIGSRTAANRYGAAILAEAVQDNPENFTRFFLVRRSGGEPGEGGNRACVALALADRPGSLRDALSAFADQELNLRSLVSRPAPDAGPFKYRFYCEIDRAEPDALMRALAEIDGESRILGAY